MKDYVWALKENKKRLNAVKEDYNPLTGKGSPVSRFEFCLEGDDYLLLPDEIKEDRGLGFVFNYSSLKDCCLSMGGDYDERVRERFLEALLRVRLKYDFEFWCITCVVIFDKLNAQEVPFRLRKAQRKLLKEMEDMRLSGEPIRIILLKARQWGGSTLIQMYMAWIQIFWRENWNLAVCADVEDQGRNIRSMYGRMAKNHPEAAMKITLNSFEGSPKVRIFEERGAVLAIGSAQKPDNLRSFDFKMIHLSEVGLWRITDGRSPEDLVQTLRAGIPDVPYTVVALESTAKGVGNFFHREWLQAKKGGSYKNIFVPWFEIEMYSKEVNDYSSLLAQMTDYHWWLFETKGATLEAINWYINFQRREQFSDWRMRSEYPSDDVEAFQSTGRRAIPAHYVAAARQSCRQALHRGELQGNAAKGKDALKGISFEKDINGRLEIWAMPDPILVRDRYCIFVDIGGRSPGADYSVIKVFDRYWLMEGGRVEVAAVWRGHLDQDLVAWKAAQIGTFYNNALLAVETNSLQKQQDTEGEHFFTVLDEISPFYPNLFARDSPDRINEGAPALYGFHTNRQTRTMIINTLIAALRDSEYTERHSISCDEMDTFEIKATGKFEAVDGCKDDCVIVTAGGLWLALKHMEPPVIVVKKPKKQTNLPVTEATF